MSRPAARAAGIAASSAHTRRDGRRALYIAKGGHVRRLVTEVMHAADHHLTGAADHE